MVEPDCITGDVGMKPMTLVGVHHRIIHQRRLTYQYFRRATNSLLAESRLRNWPYRRNYGDYWYMTPEKCEAYAGTVNEMMKLIGNKEY